MADFPALVPTIRPLTTGQWGGATLPSMSGRVSTVRRSSAEIGRRLSLRFVRASTPGLRRWSSPSGRRRRQSRLRGLWRRLRRALGLEMRLPDAGTRRDEGSQ